jgi:protein-L-isoaspartate(D-aspartate) O-methyltransferase
MAWRSSGATNEELVSNLCLNGIIKSPAINNAMLKVDRGAFCHRNPYEDKPKSIGYNATISAPHMHAHALEILAPFINPHVKSHL